MTAHDDLAVLLFESGGHDPARRVTRTIASLATNPETAPAVFAWLVEAGVLEQVGWYCGAIHRPAQTGRSGTVTGTLAFIEEERCCEGYRPTYVVPAPVEESP